jgi:hypothetical protein
LNLSTQLPTYVFNGTPLNVDLTGGHCLEHVFDCIKNPRAERLTLPTHKLTANTCLALRKRPADPRPFMR